jgi:hypothetical protein
VKTTERLANALREAGAPADMVIRAEGGYYDDFRSPLATPCIQLVNDARRHGLADIAQRAINGEFDATKEESDEWYETEGRKLVQDLPPGMRSMFERPGGA